MKLTISTLKRVINNFDSPYISDYLEKYDHKDLGSGVYCWKFYIEDSYELTIIGKDKNNRADEIRIEKIDKIKYI